MASSKIKYNIDTFYDKADKFSCHERCDIFHSVNFKISRFNSLLNLVRTGDFSTNGFTSLLVPN